MPLRGFKIDNVSNWEWLGAPKVGEPNGRPVYKGTTNSGQEVVLKIEWYSPNPPQGYSSNDVYFAQVRRSLLVMAELHKRVHQGHKQPANFPDLRLVSSQTPLQTFIDSMHAAALSNPRGNLQKSPFKDAKACAKDAREYKDQHHVILYLMDFIPNLKNVDEHTEGKILTPDWFWSLGMVAAVDCFIGSFDRFDPYNKPSALINLTNVFFATAGNNEFDAVGIDFFDPNSQWKDLYSNLSVEEQTRNLPKGEREWAGRFLEKNSTDRSKIANGFAKNIFKDKTEGLAKCAKAFLEGVDDGAERLKEIVKDGIWDTATFHLREGRTYYGPRQLEVRAKALGWWR